MLHARHGRSAGALVFVSLAALLMGASPDGCNGWDNVGVMNAHLDAASPDAMDATFENPVIVTRDNPWFVGAFFTGPNTTGTVGAHPYSASGKWFGLHGTVDLRELWSPEFAVAVQRLPVLPMQNFEGPGQATWSSRSAEFVHGNVYEANVNVIASGTHVTSPRRLYAKLSEDVELVPVVVVSWKHPGYDPGFVDHTHIAKNAFDFLPMYAPRFVPPELGVADNSAPNHTAHITPPTLWETPPDDIWDQCHIQFQVVATYVLELPQNYTPNCNTSSTTFLSLQNTQNLIKAVDPALGPALVDSLAPIYVAYGDFGTCASAMGYTGKVVGAMPLAEMDYGRTRVTTSHEVGHILLGSSHATKNGKPVSGNLMRVNPSDGDKDLTPAQCEKARKAAKTYSDRYKNWNRMTGRVDFGEIRWDLASQIVDFDFSYDTLKPGSLDDLPEQCCYDQADDEHYLAVVCGPGSVPVAASQCEVCCANGGQSDAAMSFEEDCPVAAQLPDAQCDEICCSEFDPSLFVSRYACAQAGGVEINCELAPPK